MSEPEKVQNHSHEASHESNQEFIESRKEELAREAAHEKYEKHESKAEKIDEIEEKVERQNPVKAEELLDKLEPAKEPTKVHPPNKELKAMALNNYLSDIRRHLSGTSKSFSKFIHGSTVNSVSEITGKTIVRPTAILFGGIFMFVGSTAYLLATYDTNAKYNFFVAIFLFFGGFMAGIIVELFYNLFFKKDF